MEASYQGVASCTNIMAARDAIVLANCSAYQAPTEWILALLPIITHLHLSNVKHVIWFKYSTHENSLNSNIHDQTPQFEFDKIYGTSTASKIPKRSYLNTFFNGDCRFILEDHHCYLDHNARLIDDAAFTLIMLVRNYGFMPNVDNFVCIVDKLDIHGRKNETKRVIYGIQFGEHSKMCGSLSISYATHMVISYLKEMVASLLLEKKYTKSLVYASAGFKDEVNLDNEKDRDFIAPSKYVHQVCLDHWLSVKKGFAFACCSTCMASYHLCVYLV